METSGFFNSKLIDGEYDRPYYAEDYRNNLGAIISNGVRRSGDDDLKVSVLGMTYTVSAGRAWIKGGWYYNDGNITGQIPPANVSLPRIDRIVLRFDNTDNVRAIKLAYLEGTPAAVPTAPTLTRTDDIWEISIATVTVGAGVTEINPLSVTDDRGDSTVCGWITSPVGYDDYFTSLDNRVLAHLGIINSEWLTIKDRMASVTLFKQYSERHLVTASTKTLTCGIAQYDPTGVDILNVYTNGMLDTEYTQSGRAITFNVAKEAGTEVLFVVYKSIDGTGLASVAERIDDLEDSVRGLTDIQTYICNSRTDNVEICNLINDHINATPNRSLHLHIVGQIGVSSAYSGSGTAANPWVWFNIPSGAGNVMLDFTNADALTMDAYASSMGIRNGSVNVLFACQGGQMVDIVGLRVTATNTATNTVIMFTNSTGDRHQIRAERCKVTIRANKDSYIGVNGTFRDCECQVSCLIGACYAFRNGNVLIEGGKYMAYSSSGQDNAVVYGMSGKSLVLGVDMPTIGLTGYVQTYALRGRSDNMEYMSVDTSLLIARASE